MLLQAITGFHAAFVGPRRRGLTAIFMQTKG
jgi:hypothetical protein